SAGHEEGRRQQDRHGEKEKEGGLPPWVGWVCPVVLAVLGIWVVIGLVRAFSGGGGGGGGGERGGGGGGLFAVARGGGAVGAGLRPACGWMTTSSGATPGPAVPPPSGESPLRQTLGDQTTPTTAPPAVTSVTMAAAVVAATSETAVVATLAEVGISEGV